MRRIILFALSTVISMSSVFAASMTVGAKIILNKEAKSHLFVFHNTSKQSLWLVHESAHPSASAGWTSQIDPDRWTVLLLSKANFALTCHLVNSKTAQASVSCKRYVSVKKMKNYQIPDKAKNMSYWVVENVTKSELPGKMKLRAFQESIAR